MNLQTAARVAISAVALAALVFALRGVDLARALNILLGANVVLLAAVLASQVVGTILRLVRWKYLLRPAQDVPLGALVSPLLVSNAVGNVTNTAVGAVPRTFLLSRKTGIDNGFIVGTWAQEYVLDATALVLWAVAVPFLVELPQEFRRAQLVLALPLALLLLVDLAFWRRESFFVTLLKRLGLWERILSSLPFPIRRNIEGFGDGLGAAFSQPLTFATVASTTVLVWAVEVLIFWLLLLSIDIPFGYVQASAVTVYTHLVIGIPSLPGFVGTLEVATVSLVLALGGDRSAALAFAVLLRVFLVAPSTALGLLLAWREGWRIGGSKYM